MREKLLMKSGKDWADLSHLKEIAMRESGLTISLRAKVRTKEPLHIVNIPEYGPKVSFKVGPKRHTRTVHFTKANSIKTCAKEKVR